MTSTDYVMTVSRNGQVSIPAATRARWQEDDRYLPGKVVVVDMGDHVMVAPHFKDPIRALRGVLAGRGGPSSDEMRRQARDEDANDEARPRPRLPGAGREAHSS